MSVKQSRFSSNRADFVYLSSSISSFDIIILINLVIYLIMSNVKFDVILLCELVEAKECLWNKRSELYRNKIIRENAWDEISKFLDEEYEEKTKLQKKETVEKIKSKWCNIRDAFMRSLKDKSSQSSKKEYLYHAHLQFLLAGQENDSTQSSKIVDELATSAIYESVVNPTENDHAPITGNDPLEMICSESGSASGETSTKTCKKRIRSQQNLNDLEKEIIKELKRPRLEKPPSTFFSSFEEYVTDMSENEKIELHMAVLTLIMNIKAKRSQPV
ncbi:uncharacterized protein [Parasteatoda tepidariorum]|uniref:uncharacterized protein n=1 Tax=Parasteatoda tepidariorum TaxID=114398 RepID=UPI001C724703|nr:uncharacterized protein LOC122270419 [Parasteatoda tepidariorum]